MKILARDKQGRGYHVHLKGGYFFLEWGVPLLYPPCPLVILIQNKIKLYRKQLNKKQLISFNQSHHNRYDCDEILLDRMLNAYWYNNWNMLRVEPPDKACDCHQYYGVDVHKPV